MNIGVDFKVSEHDLRFGNCSISVNIMSLYEGGLINSIRVFNESKTKLIYQYQGQDLTQLISSKRPIFKSSDSDEIDYYVVKL